MPVQLSVKLTGAEFVRQGLQDLTNEIPKIGRLGIYRMMQAVVRKLKDPAPRPNYPIEWDSEKQRRAYFATDGFGGGIPSRRSGRYQQGWNITALPTGYRLENTSPYAGYVGGDYAGEGQSRIHAGRWPLFQGVVESAIQELPPEIEQSITYYARSKGFD